jgi:DNA-binding beta-propeller fold protein YncE
MDGTNARTRRWVPLSLTATAALLLIGSATIANAQTDAYVANTGSGQVNVIDTAHPGAPPAAIDVGGTPTQVVLTADGLWAFVANSGLPIISKIDTTSRAVTTINIGDVATNIAVTPTGDRLYVLRASAMVDVFDVASGLQLPVPSIQVGGSSGGMAVTPDGKRLYVAANSVTVIDTELNQAIATFAPEVQQSAEIYNFAVGIAMSTDKLHPRAYVTVDSYEYLMTGFFATGGIAVIDDASMPLPAPDGASVVSNVIPLFSLPGSITLSADGKRAFVGIQYLWIDTLYGAGFWPAEWVAVVDTALGSAIKFVDLGADGSAWGQQHTADGLAVTPDGNSVFVAIPSIQSVTVVDTVTNLAGTPISLPGQPTAVAILPDAFVTPSVLKIVATDDLPSSSFPAGGSKPAIANVLANDTLGGGPAALANVTLSSVTSTSGLTLDSAGAVWIAAGTAAGPQALSYRICEKASAANCATADVKISVRAPYHIGAGNDAGTSVPGATAVASVLANDDLNLVTPTTADVTISVVSPGDGALTLDASGSVSVSAGAATGTHGLAYRICENASPSNCSNDATVTVTVVNRQIAAANDAASAPRTGATGIVNVLVNDTFDGAPAMLTRVTLVLPPAANGLSIDAAGFVSVASGAPTGVQTLSYSICETGRPDNCAGATVTVTVTADAVIAVNDSARLSAKTPATAIANVLANDTVGGATATTATVVLTQVSLTPSTDKIVLNTSTGAVSILKNATSGTFSLVYQICEVGSPANCAQATATINLSGGSGKGR